MQQQPYLSYSSIAVTVKSCIPDTWYVSLLSVNSTVIYCTSYFVVSYLQGKPDEGDRDAVHGPDPGQATSPAGGEVLEERCHGDGKARPTSAAAFASENSRISKGASPETLMPPPAHLMGSWCICFLSTTAQSVWLRKSRMGG